MLSDQGPSVDGIEVRDFLAKHGIIKKHSSAYHPEGDGQAERGIRAVKQIIRCLIAEHDLEDTDWPTLLSRVSYTLNAVPNTSTGFTLYRIMYGVDPKPTFRSEWDLALQDTYNSVLEWVEELQDMEDLVNEQVNDNLTEARARMKTKYDRGKKDTICHPGDWVYIKNQRRRSGLSPHFEGPYPVLSRRGPNIKLRTRNGKEKLVHLNRCKKCPQPNTEIRLEIADARDQSSQDTALSEPGSSSETGSTYENTERLAVSDDYNGTGRGYRGPTIH